MGYYLMQFLFFGMGYSSLETAKYINNNFDKKAQIIGTIRNNDSASRLARNNVSTIIFDGETVNPLLDNGIANASHIIHSIAPTEQGDVVFNHYNEQLSNAKNLQWICYFSTIGVYGNHEGNWIDESAKCEPKNLRSIERLKIESLWREFAKKNGIKLLILRLAGIYGLGRSSFDKLKNGTAKRIIKKDQVFNRIHVLDIARVTSLAAQQELSGTYNLCDDEPAPPQDVVSFAAKLSGQTMPKEIAFETANMSEMARSFYNDNKKVSNKAIKQALNIKLLYPTYREGLQAIFSA